MKYFDALINSYFKTGKDGRTLFFPWQSTGRGYVVASQEEEQRLRRYLKLYTGISFGLVMIAMAVAGWVAGLGVGVPIVVLYAVWATSMARRMQPAEERMTMQENMQVKAGGMHPVVLGLGDLFCLVLAGFAVFIVIDDPAEWRTGLSVLAIFGVGAAAFTYLLIVRFMGHQRPAH
jgi:hypothetical protein